MSMKNSEPRRRTIRVLGARENTLKNIDLEIERGSLVTVVGPSGSGKSTLLFQTLSAESTARAQLLAGIGRGRRPVRRPDCDAIVGLPFCTTVAQRAMHRSPRSTVATATGLHHVFRHLMIRHGEIRCDCGEVVVRTDRDRLIAHLRGHHPRAKITVLAVVGREPLLPLPPLETLLASEGFRLIEVQSLPGEPRRARPLAGLGGLDANGIHALAVEVGVCATAAGDKSPSLGSLMDTAFRLGTRGVIVSIAGSSSRALPIEIDTGLQAVCASCGRVHRLPDESWLSFNAHPARSGRCTTCFGLGVVDDIDLTSLVPDANLSFEQGCFALRLERKSFRFLSIREDVLRGVCGPSARVPFRRLPEATRQALLFGIGEARVLPVDTAGKASGAKVRFHGLIPALKALLSKEGETADYARGFVALHACEACEGSRFRSEVVEHCHYGGHAFTSVLHMEVDAASDFVGRRAAAAESEEQSWLDSASRILVSLRRAGLSYLALDRSLSTLSGGELQRIKIAASLHRGLTASAYILDEPSLGLHAADGAELAEVIAGLRDAGNTVLVADHDPVFRQAADRIVALGPGAGSAGGRLIKADDEPRGVAVRPKPRRTERTFLELLGCATNNLRDVDVRIPLGALTCLTGVSGSGKSSFAHGCLVPAVTDFVATGRTRGRSWKGLRGAMNVRKVLTLRQQPIGTSITSVVATYLDIYQSIRELFAGTQAAREAGLSPGHFSFNRPEGRCPVCLGRGVLVDDANEGDAHPLSCDECEGMRFVPAVLEVRWQDQSIGDVLRMESAQAVKFFSAVESVSGPLGKLVELGAGHLQLGRPTPMISGGEAQRLKLAKSLAGAEGRQGGMLLILDEPTAGLHRSDVARLVAMLDELRDGDANTIVVIEHDLDLIATADWVVDFGPGAGRDGGTIVHSGTVDELLNCEASRTGWALAKAARHVNERRSSSASYGRSPTHGLVRANSADVSWQREVQRFQAALRQLDRTPLYDDTEAAPNGVCPSFRLDHDIRRFAEDQKIPDVLGLRQRLQRVLLPHVVGPPNCKGRLISGMLDRRAGAPGACRHCDGRGALQSCNERLVIRNAKATLLSPAFFTNEAGELLKAVHSRLSKAIDRFIAERCIDPDRFVLDPRTRGLILFGVPGVRFPIKGRSGDKRVDHHEWVGLIPLVLERLHLSKQPGWRKRVETSQKLVDCFACAGTGYVPQMAMSTIFGISVPQFMSQTAVGKVARRLRERVKDRNGRLVVDILDDLVEAKAESVTLDSYWRDLSDVLRERVQVVALKHLHFADASHAIALSEPELLQRMLQVIADDCEVVVVASD